MSTPFAIDYHYQNYTLTTSVTNARPQKCRCGRKLEAGEAVAIVPSGPYRIARARRLCLACALSEVKILALPTFRKLESKPYPHYVEDDFDRGSYAKETVLQSFADAYHPQTKRRNQRPARSAGVDEGQSNQIQ